TVLPDSLIEGTTQQPLREVDYSYPVQAGLAAQGCPYAFYRLGKQLVLYPTPDAEYTIQFYFYSAVGSLTSDMDQPELPETWEKILILGAQSRLEKFLGESGSETYLLYRDGLDLLRSRSPLKPTYRMQGPYRGYRGTT